MEDQLLVENDVIYILVKLKHLLDYFEIDYKMSK